MFSPSHAQRGSSLFIILVAVALFAALSYALSQQGDGVRSLSNEKIRLLASDVIDMGNGLADATSRLRLHGVAETAISFENSIIGGYANADCTAGTCKVFDFDGGGKDWETPTIEINGAVDMGISGDLAIKNIGTASADLVAIIPDLSDDICTRINTLLNLPGGSSGPSVIATATATKFTGAYSGAPTLLTSTQIDGQKSGCVEITSASGSAFTGTPLSSTNVFYQVLLAR